MTSSATFSPSSFLSFFDFPVVAATSANSSSSSSVSSHSHTQRPASLFDLSCLQPDINSPPIVTSPVPAAPPHSHFFPTVGAGHTRSPSTSSTLSSSSSSPSLRSSLPSSASSLSSCSSPKSPPTNAVSSTTPPSFSSSSSSNSSCATSASAGHGPFTFELSSLTSWLDSLFPAEDNSTSSAQPQPDSQRQHTDSVSKSNVQHQQQPMQEHASAAATPGVGARRPCRPRLSPSSTSPASSASLVRALSSHPKKPSTLATSSKADVNIAHPASSPMSIARTSALLTRKPITPTASSSPPSASLPPSPPVDLDETVASLLADGAGIVRGGLSGGGALSPLPEVQVVEALTPDSPSHVLTLDVHRTDEAVDGGLVADGVMGSTMIAEEDADNLQAADERQVPFVDFVIAGIPVGQSLHHQALATPRVSPLATALTVPRSSHVSPPASPTASLLSSALLEADLDYFHVDRETAIAVEQLTSPTPRSPLSMDDTVDDSAELTWEEEEDEEDEQEVVRLRGEPRRHSRPGQAEEEDWEVCRVHEGGGAGTDDEYEML